MSAIKKWALGGLIACIIGMFVFGFVLVTGEMPGAVVLGIITFVVGFLGTFGIIVKLPGWSDPPNARAPPS